MTFTPLSAGFALLDGTRFCYSDPGATEYPVEEIARGLSHAARFGGHTTHWFPVAMHCYNGSMCLEDPADQYAFLMHDALEGLLGFDPPTPIKHFIPGIKDLEDSLHPVLAEQFGFQYPYTDAVKKMDTDMLVVENKYLRNGKQLIGIDIDTYDVSHIYPLVDMGIINLGRVTPEQARTLWLDRYYQLCPLEAAA